MPSATTKGEEQALTASLPGDLFRYVQEGHPVRTLASDPLAGRCGAAKKKRSSKTAYCEYGAGLGTNHPKVGRCHLHEGDYHAGLAPWIGELTEDLWFEITGSRRTVPGTAGFPTTHGAADGLKPFEEILFRRLDAEDREAFQNAPIDVHDLIRANVRERWMAKDRIYRHIQNVRVRIEGQKRDVMLAIQAETDPAKRRDMMQQLRELDAYASAIVVEVDPTLNKITSVIARLLEVSARFEELKGAEATRDSLRKALTVLSDDDFARMKGDPRALAHLVTAAGGVSS